MIKFQYQHGQSKLVFTHVISTWRPMSFFFFFFTSPASLMWRVVDSSWYLISRGYIIKGAGSPWFDVREFALVRSFGSRAMIEA